ncbi:MAG: HAMP domain-containing sensor histidine kinase [Campylobacterota bacterium]|nr:HAMP domain-containing sensor histidine kinase [Campylobacterota bacterium]
MNLSYKNSNYKKLILLIGIFIFGFVSLFSLNKVFQSLVNELDKETKNLEAKLAIGEFIAYDIIEIRSLFHELATTTTTQRSRDRVIEKIENTIDIVEDSLDVLEKGGTLKRFVALNIAGHLNTIKVVRYKKINKDEFSLETIDIKPKLEEISFIIKEVNTLLVNRSKSKKEKNTKEFMKSAKEIRRYYKALPAYFVRLSENIRRLLYEGEIELKSLSSKIEEDKIKYMQLKLYLIFFVISVVVIFGYIIAKRVNKDSEDIHNLNFELHNKLEKEERQENSIRAILDAQPNIIIVSDGITMVNANHQLIEFFDNFKSFEEFKKEHRCICDFFENNVPDDNYINKQTYGDLSWIEYILKNSDKNFKVIMKKNGLKHHFAIIVNKKIVNKATKEAVIVTTLNDITAEINSQIKLKSLNDNLGLIVANKTKELNELNENLEQKIIIETQKVREKDKQMTQQARFAAMGEMIGNIAHQWRQPLSAINSTASGMELQMQLGIASNDDISESYKKIMGYVDFLSQTIEDFRGFFKEDKEKIDFNAVDTLKHTLSIISALYKDNDIKVIKEFKDEELFTLGMPSELSQVFLNILNNAKDALVSNKIDKKIVYIRCEIEDKTNVIYIQDNAGGIPEDILDKIFDPYFTTKHQSQGTGIGLYMSKDIVEKHMNGKISVKNLTTNLDGEEYFGACFKIELLKKVHQT